MNTRTRHWASVLPVILIAIAIQACTGVATTPSPGSTAAPSSAPSATASVPTPAPTIAPDAAPPELLGKWGTDLGAGDHATLRIDETSYQISRGGAGGGGDISVTGDMIEFSNADLCPGAVGTYRWKIVGDILTFTLVGATDGCPRTDVLLGELKRVPS